MNVATLLINRTFKTKSLRNKEKGQGGENENSILNKCSFRMLPACSITQDLGLYSEGLEFFLRLQIYLDLGPFASFIQRLDCQSGNWYLESLIQLSC